MPGRTRRFVTSGLFEHAYNSISDTLPQSGGVARVRCRVDHIAPRMARGTNMHDAAKITLIVASIGLVVGVIFFTSFAFSTSGASRNISLALGTLLGSAVLLGIQ